jgi:acyl-CoA synthetase (AMP-forming)/AMP-acid ligase II
MVERLRAASSRAELYLMYGQTEATARLATLLPHDVATRPGSIGKAIPGVSLAVLDEEGRLAPPGETGEIVARGDNVMVGYWNDPEETARVLRPDGLHTGDLARMDEDGYLYIVGRQSDIIKCGAYRISPKEIEEAILELDGVAEVAVTGRPDELLGEAPVALVVPEGDGLLSPQAVLDHCREALPRHKMVREVRLVPALPKAASGKVRRSDLACLWP